MDYIKFLSTVPGAFTTVASGTPYEGVDPDYMIDDWNVWVGSEGTFPLEELSSHLCITNPLVHNFMTAEEITTYSGGE